MARFDASAHGGNRQEAKMVEFPTLPPSPPVLPVPDAAEAMKAVAALSQGWSAVAAELIAFSKDCLERNVETAGRMASVRSFDKLWEIQGEYLRASFDATADEAARLQNMLMELGAHAMAVSSRAKFAKPD
jgi:hypothetical protein